ncbi:twin-arginine translocation signal domain-containing protein [Candidatus Woesearchaeota archaeon]|nr:twin-arginine translocation signal domain-containing protein [Candidatus Woesearchaeota archaeon]
MPEKEKTGSLTQEEEKLKLIWKSILKKLREDLGFIWTEDVKQRFKELKTELDQIEFILERLEEHAAKKEYSDALKDIADMKSKLKKIKPTSRWVKEMTDEIKKLIFETAKGTSRRRFLKTAGAAAGGGLLYSLGRRFGLFGREEKKETPEQAAKRKADEKIAAIVREIEERFVHKKAGNYKINYQNYTDTLEILFNAGEYDAAKKLCDNSYNIVVLIKKSVLNELTNAFSHEVEIEYLLFADRQGRIIRVERTPIMSKEYSSGTVWRNYHKSDELIEKIEKEGYTFVGAYHNHEKTKEEIKKARAKWVANREENVPSPDDWEIFRATNRETAVADKEKIIMIGGLDVNQGFKFRIRAFTGGKRFRPKPYNVYKKFAWDYNKSKGEPKSVCLKLELKLKAF